MLLYIHIPFCVRKCSYCDFLSFPGKEPNCQKDYVRALIREIQAYAGGGGDGMPAGMPSGIPPVETVFFGGGTPSILPAEWIEAILENVRRAFSVAEGAEISLEANPGTVTPEKAAGWKRAGINRISMGVQSLDDALLKKLGRIHRKKEVLESYRMLREAGFDNVSFDLMSGLPDQTEEDWMATLREAVKLRPEHLSCYSLILEEGTPFYRQQDSLHLPDEDEERRMYREGALFLEEQGYHRYEISNFALTGRESRHNSGYWKRTPYIGLGLGASSLFREKNGTEYRWKNTDSLERYLSLSGTPDAMREELAALSEQDCMEEFAFLGLRMSRGIRREDFAKRFGVPIDTYYKEAIDKHLADGLLREAEGRLFLTDRGIDLSNQVFVDFLF